MHELSIAQNIVTIVKEYLPPGSRLKSLHLRIGDLSGVVPDTLEFCLRAITTDTPLADARLKTERVPYTMKCKSCGHSSSNNVGIAICDRCCGADVDVLGGFELEIKEIEILTVEGATA